MWFTFDEYRPVRASFFGVLVWTLLATLSGLRRSPLGVIELLLTFAVLVIVPLGLELAPSVTAPHFAELESTARRLQPIAAACTVASFWFGPGLASGMLILPWFVTAAFMAVSALGGLYHSRSAIDYVGNIARLDLGIAGAWLLISRFGIQTGFYEPIPLLTAVHFHYSGFATALIAASGARWAQGSDRQDGWKKVSLTVAFLPFVVAAGFVMSPTLRVFAVCAFALSMVGLAVLLTMETRSLTVLTARILLRVAALVSLAGMSLASVYAIGEYAHQDWLTIPRMATTHGWMNAMGFVLPGLLAWLVQFQAQRPALPQSRLVVGERSGRIFHPAFLARDFYDR